MTRPSNTAAIEKATGRDWSDWVTLLDGAGAKNLPHNEIARLVHDEWGTTGWWAQSVTVAYEQQIGRRIPGQDCNGEFSVSVSKTVPGTMDEALEKWVALVGERTEFSDVPVFGEPTVSATEKWRYWRCQLEDGTRVSVTIHQKSPDKAALGIGHEKLETPEAALHWRPFWKQLVAELGG
ncbi:hypothetical protein [Rhodococcus sp. NPDC058514]|uniref:hypothetical protein n=1 Tax=unclassified Rhodococcus (in: high G+C Gram-positive bacteria) TaxID=192944 RepID=UPI0036557A26